MHARRVGVRSGELGAQFDSAMVAAPNEYDEDAGISARSHRLG